MTIHEGANLKQPHGTPGGTTRVTSARGGGQKGSWHWIGAAAAAAILVLVCGLALLAPWLPLPDPYVQVGDIAAEPGGEHLLGTDQLGRDVLSRVIWGGRVSILVAVVATTTAMAIGLILGMVAGYFRGWVDTAVVWFIDITLAFPTLVLLMAIIAVRGASTSNLIFGMFVILVTGFARLSRASTIAFTDREFVRAARGLGASNFRVLRHHLLPNVFPSASAYALSASAHVFLVEGSLSFLGVGVPPPTASWGGMIEGGRPMFDRAPHIVLGPGLVMLCTIAAFNVLGDYFQQGRQAADVVTL